MLLLVMLFLLLRLLLLLLPQVLLLLLLILLQRAQQLLHIPLKPGAYESLCLAFPSGRLPHRFYGWFAIFIRARFPLIISMLVELTRPPNWLSWS